MINKLLLLYEISYNEILLTSSEMMDVNEHSVQNYTLKESLITISKSVTLKKRKKKVKMNAKLAALYITLG